MSGPLFRAEGIIKRFGGVTALAGVTLDLAAGEIHSLCGENGAGKSTLIKILGGIWPAESFEGQLYMEGQPVNFRSVRDSERAGIAVVHQELALVSEMTVAENVFLGAEPTRGPYIDWQRMMDEAARLFAQFKIDIDVAAPIGSLGVGFRQLVEIVRALRKKSRIIVLDEPTAALADHEVAVLLDIVRDLRSRGVTCAYISHKLEEVFAISDRITVLRDGRSIVTLDAKKTNANEVIKNMVGREIKDLFPRKVTAIASPKTLLQVEHLEVAPDKQSEEPRLKNISFEARAGEVLGIGGLMGAGRTELVMHLFGAWGDRRAGRVSVDGVSLPGPGQGQEHGPRSSMAAGMVLVTEDRKRYGLVLDQSVGFNMSLSVIDRYTRHGIIDEAEERRSIRPLFQSLRVKALDLDARVGNLSGGNQQKVVIGKALLCEPKVVLLDEPTRGIDVGAKVDVYNLINQLTAEGKAVVLVSSELPELLGMSDRVLVLHEGTVTGEFDRASATPEKVLAAAMGRSATN